MTGARSTEPTEPTEPTGTTGTTAPVAQAAPEPDQRAEAPVVAVGFDGSEGSLRALDWAARECELRRAVLLVLHADHWSPAALALPALHEEVALEETVLDEGVRLAREGHPTIEVVGRRVPPPAEESLVAATHDASLLVVGSRGLRHVQKVVLGSVSRYCVNHAHCPVVVVRGTAAGRDASRPGGTAPPAQRSADPAAVGTSSPSER